MLTLLHMPLCPFSRLARLALAEKGFAFDLVRIHPWEDEDFPRLNPAGTVPVLVVDERHVVPDSLVIAEFAEENAPEPTLLPGGPLARAEARRLAHWLAGGLWPEVVEPLLFEKVMRREKHMGGPDMTRIREARARRPAHLDVLEGLADRRHFLAGERLSLADLAAAAQISTLDFLDDVPWEDHPRLKEWYARVKSRPSFRPLLADQTAGIEPPAHYADLDF
ncbi:MAG: glutathione S-transferase family protein [Alphaproteobacteria bacterium]|nr:glutathione S-transferase family protein [Alphaproteobacteria bacterium]